MQIEQKSGNEYLVTCPTCHDSRIINLDGLTIVSPEDEAKLEAAGLYDDTTMITPDYHNGDTYWQAAADYVLSYSGFNADDYIRENR